MKRGLLAPLSSPQNSNIKKNDNDVKFIIHIKREMRRVQRLTTVTFEIRSDPVLWLVVFVLFKPLCISHGCGIFYIKFCGGLRIKCCTLKGKLYTGCLPFLCLF